LPYRTILHSGEFYTAISANPMRARRATSGSCHGETFEDRRSLGTQCAHRRSPHVVARKVEKLLQAQARACTLQCQHACSAVDGSNPGPRLRKFVSQAKLTRKLGRSGGPNLCFILVPIDNHWLGASSDKAIASMLLVPIDGRPASRCGA